MPPVVLLAQIAAVLGGPSAVLEDALVLGPRWADASGPTLAPLALELDCTRGGDACDFRVRATVTVREARAATGAFYVGGVREVDVELDGAPARAPSTLPPELASFDVGFRGPAYVAPGDADPGRAIAFVVPGAARGGAPERHELVVHGRVRLAPWVPTVPDRVLASEAIAARHPLLGAIGARRAAGLLVASPAQRIAPERTARGLLHHGVVTARAPETWRLEGRGDRGCPLAVTGLSEAACGGRDVEERTSGGVRERVAVASPLGTLLVVGARAETPPAPAVLTPGGPVLGAGWAFGLRDGFRGRLGYEAGVGRAGTFVGGVAVESDLHRRLELAPTLVAGTRAAMLRPSVGMGLGVPVALLPEPGVSGRLRLDASWVGLGIAADLDLHAAPRFGATFGLTASLGL